jgi:transcriptional regulator with XRE-family HTH domain
MQDLTQLLEHGSDLARIMDLRVAQAEGELPPAGKITQAQIARALGLSRTEYLRIESIALAKVAAKLGTHKQITDLLHDIP